MLLFNENLHNMRKFFLEKMLMTFCLAEKDFLLIFLFLVIFCFGYKVKRKIWLFQNRVILRLHKTRRDSPALGNLEFEEMNRVCREALFCRKVMVPLLGKAYIQPPSVGRVPDKEIQQLDHILLPQVWVFNVIQGFCLYF